MGPSRTFNLCGRTEFFLWGRKNFLHCRGNRAGRNVTLFFSNDIWRRQQDVIAVCPVHAALRWIRKYALIHGNLKDPAGDVFFARKRRSRGFVFYELDTRQKAQAANVSHMAMFFERLQRGRKLATRRWHSRKQRLFFHDIEHGVARRH